VDGPLPGVPAITRNAAGAGVAWYVATQPDRESLEGLVGRVAAEAGVSADVPTAPGVETVRRHGEDGTSWLFVMNHTNETAHVPVGGVDILSGAEHEAPMQVAAGGVAVVRIPG
jgi:beta-galactosidase